MAADATPGSRHLLNVLIKGAGSGPTAVTGLQVRLDNEFGPSVPRTPKAQPRYAYDPVTRGLMTINAPLDRPLITLLPNNRQRVKFFKHDRHPTEALAAWAWRYDMQYDVWARTPVECDAISDFLSGALVLMAESYWQNLRIGIELETFEDVPYEVEQNIYRSMAHGNVTIAATAAD